MRNLYSYLLWIFVLIHGLNQVKSASISGAQDDIHPDLIAPTNIEPPKTNVLALVDAPEQGADVQRKDLENSQYRPIIDNDGLNPRLPLSDPESQNFNTGHSLNKDVNNQLASSSNVVPQENVLKAVNNTGDSKPSHSSSNDINQYYGDKDASIPNEVPVNAVAPPISKTESENNAVPLVNNNISPKDVFPANEAAAPAYSRIENIYPAQTYTTNKQNQMPNETNVDQSPGIYVPVPNSITGDSKSTGDLEPIQNQMPMNVDQPMVGQAPLTTDVDQSLSNSVPVQSPVSASESKLPGNIVPIQNQMPMNVDHPMVGQAPLTTDVDQSLSNYVPVQSPVSASESKLPGNIEPIQNQMPMNVDQPMVGQAPLTTDVDQSPSNYVPVQNQVSVSESKLPGTVEPVQTLVSTNVKPYITKGDEATENTENDLEHPTANMYTETVTSQVDDDSEEKSMIETGAGNNNDYSKNPISSSTSSLDDDYNYEYESEKDDDNADDIFDTKWWNNDDGDDWDEDDFADENYEEEDDYDDYYDDEDEDDEDDFADENYEEEDDYDDYYDDEDEDDDDDDDDDESLDNGDKVKTQLTTTSKAHFYPDDTKPWTDSSTTETTEDSVDAGKGLMESVHHFDNNFGPFGGAKVSGKGKRLGGDGFAYSWTLLVAFCVILICLFVFWNRHKVEKYIVSLRQPSPGNQNRGRLYKDEDKNLLDNEYT